MSVEMETPAVVHLYHCFLVQLCIDQMQEIHFLAFDLSFTDRMF